MSSAPAVAAVRPIEIEDLAGVRSQLTSALDFLDELLADTVENVGPDAVFTPNTAKQRIEQDAAHLRAVLQVAASKLNTLEAILRMAAAQRQRNREIGDAWRAAKGQRGR